MVILSIKEFIVMQWIVFIFDGRYGEIGLENEQELRKGKRRNFQDNFGVCVFIGYLMLFLMLIRKNFFIIFIDLWFFLDFEILLGGD